MTVEHSACPPGVFALFCILVALVAACSGAPTAAVPATTAPTTAVSVTAVPAVAVPAPDRPTAATPAVPPGTYWPTEGWRTSSPEEQGLDARELGRMLAAVEEQHLALHSLLVIRHGYVVSETYFGSDRQDTRREIYSCTKAFVSTLVGIAIDKGYVDGTDHRILDFFPGRTFANLDGQKQAMTLDDLLTMRSGLDWQEDRMDPRDVYISRDWVGFMLDRPMVASPGSLFNYCSGCSHILSAILRETTGMNPRDLAEQELFRPLGMANVNWDTDAAGTPIGGWGLQLTPRDMAKLGYLYLHSGRWDGRQIVSAQWVANATRTHAETDGDLDYGYQWWIYPSLGGYAALGLYGQMILVIPGSDLIVVTTAQMDNHDEIFRLVEQYILPAVLSP